LVARTASIGLLAGDFIDQPKVGIRKPPSKKRKSKARKLAKISSSSRRRNRQ